MGKKKLIIVKSALSIFLTILCGVSFICDLAFADELQIIYNVKANKIIEQNDGKEKEENHQWQNTIRLGDNYLCVFNDDMKVLYDFKKQKIFYIDDKKKTYSDISLFSNIGVRAMEFRNRLFIRDVLRKASNAAREDGKDVPEINTSDIFDIETLFSIEDKNSGKREIYEITKGVFHKYRFENEVIAECSFSNHALDGKNKLMFAKYLIYDCYIHPQIRKKIVEKGNIPQLLKYTYKDNMLTTTSVEIRLQNVSSSKNSYVIPSDYSKAYDDSNKLAVIIKTVMTGKTSIKQLNKEDFIKIIDKKIEEGNNFDALLAFLECGLQTGDDLVEKLRDIMSVIDDNDKRLQMFMQSMGVKDEESAKRAIETLESINRDGLDHGYVIDIMIADDKMGLGQAGAKDLFIKVLTSNPYIAGVYNDLGDLFNHSYDTVSAWQCWDIARYLYPNHKMLQQINEYEKWLTDNFAEFF